MEEKGHKYTHKEYAKAKMSQDGEPYAVSQNGICVRLTGKPSFFMQALKTKYGKKKGREYAEAFLKTWKTISETAIEIEDEEGNKKKGPLSIFTLYFYNGK